MRAADRSQGVPESALPAVIAHRGASRQRRENTVAAFERAVVLGAHWVELDVRLTADRELVVHHNPTLADGRALKDLSRSQLPRFVPTLAAALAACGPLGVNIEIKNGETEVDFDPLHEAAAMIASMQLPYDRTLISSFNLDTLVALRAASDMRIALLTFGLTSTEDVLAVCGDYGFEAWHPYFRTIDRAAVDLAHDRGVEVNVWTVDAPGDIESMIAANVDGICTNVPDLVRSISRGTL